MIHQGRWRMIVAGILTIGLVLVPGAVSAQEPDENEEADADAVIDLLIAAGVPADHIDEDFQDRVRTSVRELVDGGVIDRAALGELRQIVREGRIDEAIEERVGRGHER